MVQELLEKREILSDIAAELYGEFWVTEKEFWGSTTERQMLEITEKLHELGWEESYDQEDIDLAEKIMDLLKKKENLTKIKNNAQETWFPQIPFVYSQSIKKINKSYARFTKNRFFNR